MVLEYAHLHDWAIFGINVGQYSSTMKHLGKISSSQHRREIISLMKSQVNMDVRRLQSAKVRPNTTRNFCIKTIAPDMGRCRPIMRHNLGPPTASEGAGTGGSCCQGQGVVVVCTMRLSGTTMEVERCCKSFPAR